MINQNLLFIILVVIIVVLVFYLFRVETFQTNEDYTRIKERVINELKKNNLFDNLELEKIKLDSDGKLQDFFKNLKVYFEERLDDGSSLQKFLELEKKFLENEELLSKI